MSYRVAPILAACAALAIAGCVGRAPVGNISELDSNDRVTGTHATVITGADLRNESGSLLETMSRRLVSFRVDNSFRCPAITLRGNSNTVPGLTDPLVYVDGTRTLDTCILSMLTAADVARVEIYPMGFTDRPGYMAHSHGLILVFMRDR
jgi:hypothetical protein